MEFKHVPIMLEECISGLNIKPNGVYVDGTIGGGGHASKIAEMLNSSGVLIGIDRDLDALNASKIRLKDAKCKVIFVHDNFKNLRKILNDLKIDKIDGILLDLGVSSYQIDEISRGFSYSKSAPLDMRMDFSQSLDAKKVVNNYKESDLIRILFEYGEENFAKSIVKNIVEARKIKEITTTEELKNIIEKSVPKKYVVKGGVAKKTFQAIRIEVNDELNSIKSALDDIINSLNPEGRCCIISFHSLEDRIVKDCFKLHATDCICDKSLPICVCGHKSDVKIISKKPIIPSEKEQMENSRSKSSKLRIIEKI